MGDFGDGFLDRPQLQSIGEIVGEIDCHEPRFDLVQERLWIIVPRRFIAIAIVICIELASIIAHRLGTVRRADHILILEAGSISEYGAYRALADDCGLRAWGALRRGFASGGCLGGIAQRKGDRT